MRHIARVDTACVFFKDLIDFFPFCNSRSTSASCIVKFPGHLLSDEVLLAVREWEREGMGIKLD